MPTARQESGLGGNCLCKEAMKGARLHIGQNAGVPSLISSSTLTNRGGGNESLEESGGRIWGNSETNFH